MDEDMQTSLIDLLRQNIKVQGQIVAKLESSQASAKIDTAVEADNNSIHDASPPVIVKAVTEAPCMEEDEAVSRWSEALKFEKQKVEQVKTQLQKHHILHMRISRLPAGYESQVTHKELQRGLRDLRLDEDVLYRTINSSAKRACEETDSVWRHLTLTECGEVDDLALFFFKPSYVEDLRFKIIVM
ncbi:hypothetical protein LTS08_007693 [Lithohypha guttulata]|uniref:Uncharacterized protein n=1 Tax=Lithohypha guttulata TaxID=1690604 RepID=A0AAN7PQ32_9EURO|nr:hypothetical protein LTR05_008644 [Lithohypha guttulata]KAK5096437.1 hypothetical protein LTS08_007693 [Lithohypha guttulata]